MGEDKKEDCSNQPPQYPFGARSIRSNITSPYQGEACYIENTFLLIFLCVLYRLKSIDLFPPGVARLDHADGGLLHLATLLWGHFQLRQMVGSVFVDVEEDVLADAGS